MGKASQSKTHTNVTSVKATLYKERPIIVNKADIMMDKITTILQTDSTCKKNKRRYSEDYVSKCYDKGRELQAKLQDMGKINCVKTLRSLRSKLHKLDGYMKRFRHAEEKVLVP